MLYFVVLNALKGTTRFTTIETETYKKRVWNIKPVLETEECEVYRWNLCSSMGTEILFQLIQGRRGLVDDQQQVKRLPWAISVMSGGNQRASASASLSLLQPQLCHICNPSYSSYTNSQNIAHDPVWFYLKSSGVTYLWFCLAGVHATSLSTLGISTFATPNLHLGTWANRTHQVENLPLSWSNSWSSEALSKHLF